VNKLFAIFFQYPKILRCSTLCSTITLLEALCLLVFFAFGLTPFRRVCLLGGSSLFLFADALQNRYPHAQQYL
jgi:hypothetical protein